MGLRTGQFVSSRPAKPAWGAAKPIRVETPAAGAEWSATVPGGRRWFVVSALAKFVTSAQAANRTARVRIKSAAGDRLVVLTPTAVIAASNTTFIQTYIGSVARAALGEVQELSPLPEMVMEEGATIASESLLLQTEDQYSEVRLWVEEYDVYAGHVKDDLEHVLDEFHELKEHLGYGSPA